VHFVKTKYGISAENIHPQTPLHFLALAKARLLALSYGFSVSF
jgi:hypothetical protein